MQGLIETWLIYAQKLGYFNAQQMAAINAQPLSANIFSSFLSQKQLLFTRLVAIEWLLAQTAARLGFCELQNFQLHQEQKIQYLKQSQNYPFTLVSGNWISQEQLNQVLKSIDKSLQQEFQTMYSYYYQESKQRLQTQQLPAMKRARPTTGQMPQITKLPQTHQTTKPQESASPSQIIQEEINDIENLMASKDEIKISDKIGRYELIKEIGQGGMGKVYQAFDPKLNRDIALKIIIAGAHASKQMIERFKQEAEATAALKHPNIVGVYDIGQEGDTYYFTMDFIRGGTLGDYLKKSKLSYRKLAQLMQKIALALAEAHRLGIIHRDLKPANVMMNEKKEPQVMDFGLAKLTESDKELSRTGAIMGTPAYMPPEQAEGKAKQMDARGDVYSLGAILYVMLTGRPPFEGQEAMKIVMQVINEEPIAPHTLNPDIPIELEAICLKCLEKKAGLRYQSSKALARDLQNFIDNKPVTAKPATKLTYLKKWIARNKVLSGAIVIVFMSLIASIFFLMSSLQTEIKAKEKEKKLAKNLQKQIEIATKAKEKEKQANKKLQKQIDIVKKAEKKAKKEKKRAKKAEKKAIHELYYSNLSLLQKYIEKSEIRGAKRILKYGKKKFKKKTRWEWEWLKQQTQQEFFSKRHKGHSADSARGCAFSPDGNIIALLTHFRLVFYDVLTMKGKIFCSSKKGFFDAFAFSPDGKIIAVASTHQTREHEEAPSYIELRDVNNSKILKRFVHKPSYGLSWCAFHPSGKYLASCYDDGEGKDPTEGEFLRKPKLSKTFVLWNIKSGKKIREETIYQEPFDNNVEFCDFHPNGKWLLIGGQGGGEDKRLILLDLKKNKKEYLKGHSNYVLCCRFSPDGKWIASGDEDGKLIIWDFKARKKIHQMETRGKIKHCYFTPDSQTLISSGTDQKIPLWDIKTGIQKKAFVGHTQQVSFCSISPDGKLFVSLAEDTNLKLWQLKSLWPKVIKMKKAIKGCSIAPDGKTLVITQDHEKTILYDLLRNREIKELKNAKLARSCDFNPKGDKVFISTDLANTRVIDIQSGKVLAKCFGDNVDSISYINQIGWTIFSPDNFKLIAGLKLPYIYMWDFAKNSAKNLKIFSFDGRFKRNIQVHSQYEYVQAIFSPDGKQVISPDPNSVRRKAQIRIWNVRSNKRIVRPRSKITIPDKVFKHTAKSFSSSRNTCLAISKDSKYLLSNRGDVIMLWDWKKKKLKALFLEHTKPVTHCAFFPYKDNERFVSVDKQGILKIWETKAESEEIDKDLKCKIIRRSLLSIDAHTKEITALEISNDGKTIVTGSKDRKVKIWSIHKKNK